MRGGARNNVGWGAYSSVKVGGVVCCSTGRGDGSSGGSDAEDEDAMSARLREVEAQAAALRLELEKRKQQQQQQQQQLEDEVLKQAPEDDMAGKQTMDNRETTTAAEKKKSRGKTYTQMQAARGVGGLEQAIGYVNRGARGISEVELLSNATDDETAEDAEERASSFRRNLIAWGIGTVAVIGLSLIRLPAPKPDRPTWFYLIAALRLQRQLDGLREVRTLHFSRREQSRHVHS